MLYNRVVTEVKAFFVLIFGTSVLIKYNLLAALAVATKPSSSVTRDKRATAGAVSFYEQKNRTGADNTGSVTSLRPCGIEVARNEHNTYKVRAIMIPQLLVKRNLTGARPRTAPVNWPAGLAPSAAAWPSLSLGPPILDFSSPIPRLILLMVSPVFPYWSGGGLTASWAGRGGQ